MDDINFVLIHCKADWHSIVLENFSPILLYVFPLSAKQSSLKSPNLARRMHTSSRKVMLKLRQIRHVSARKRMRSA